MQRIGLISDTHGLLRPEAVDFLRGCDRIVHAGDVCDAGVLDRLSTIAPVVAVRGNNDRGDWADALAAETTLRIEDVTLFVIHDVAELARRDLADDVAIVVHGHSHRPTAVARAGRTWINPGSAGPRRFRLPISIGELTVDRARFETRLVALVA